MDRIRSSVWCRADRLQKVIRDYRLEYLRTLNGVRVAHISETFFIAEIYRVAPADAIVNGQCEAIAVIGSIVRSLADFYHESAESLYGKRQPINYYEKFWSWRWWCDCFWLDERNSVICVEWIEVVIAAAKNRDWVQYHCRMGIARMPISLFVVWEKSWAGYTISVAGIFNRLVVPMNCVQSASAPF